MIEPGRAQERAGHAEAHAPYSATPTASRAPASPTIEQPDGAVAAQALEGPSLDTEHQPERPAGKDRGGRPARRRPPRRRRPCSRSRTDTDGDGDRHHQQTLEPAPDPGRRVGSPVGRGTLTSRATVACSAEPGTMRIVKAASSAPSEP